MKRILAIVLAAVSLIGLCACGSSKGNITFDSKEQMQTALAGRYRMPDEYAYATMEEKDPAEYTDMWDMIANVVGSGIGYRDVEISGEEFCTNRYDSEEEAADPEADHGRSTTFIEYHPRGGYISTITDRWYVSLNDAGQITLTSNADPNYVLTKIE